jgi:hypothetical protein
MLLARTHRNRPDWWSSKKRLIGCEQPLNKQLGNFEDVANVIDFFVSRK